MRVCLYILVVGIMHECKSSLLDLTDPPLYFDTELALIFTNSEAECLLASFAASPFSVLCHTGQ